jgi:hypothetical protein
MLAGVDHITTDGFANELDLPNLMARGCDRKPSDDVAIGHIAAMPRLKRLRIQESRRTDDGFVWPLVSDSRELVITGELSLYGLASCPRPLILGAG